MWALANGCPTSSAGDPAQIIEIAAKGTNMVGWMIGVIRGD